MFALANNRAESAGTNSLVNDLALKFLFLILFCIEVVTKLFRFLFTFNTYLMSSFDMQKSIYAAQLFYFQFNQILFVAMKLLQQLFYNIMTFI